MNSTDYKGKKIRNLRTGEVGTITGMWLNEVTQQPVVNVKVDGRAASWTFLSIGKVA